MKRQLLRSIEGLILKKYMKRMYLQERQKLNSPEILALEDDGMLELQESPTMDISRKRKPAWVREIIQEAEIYGAPEGSTRTSKRSNPYSSYVALMCDLVDQEPTSYEEAELKKEWVEEMTKEYQSIMKNDVWDIVPKPKTRVWYLQSGSTR